MVYREALALAEEFQNGWQPTSHELYERVAPGEPRHIQAGKAGSVMYRARTILSTLDTPLYVQKLGDHYQLMNPDNVNECVSNGSQTITSRFRRPTKMIEQAFQIARDAEDPMLIGEVTEVTHALLLDMTRAQNRILAKSGPSNPNPK